MPRLEHLNLRRAILVGAACLLATLSCGRDVTGPQALRLMRGFSFDVRFDAPGLADGVAGEIVQFDRVRVVLVNTLGDTVVDRVVDFPSTAEEVELALDVPITTGAPPSGEMMSLALRYINAQNDTVFRGGPLPVPVAPTLPGQTPPQPPVIPVTYTGIGADAVSVVVTPQSDTVLAGDAFAFTAVALDGQGQPLANTPVAWRSETPARATITAPGAGAGTSLPSRGPATIIAQLLTGPADTVALEVLPRAQTLTIVSGNDQAAAFGATLAQPLVARVVATDGQPMAGVSVDFAVTSGGGSVSAPSVVTDANGLAQVTWTTGTGLGAQVVTATVAGLAGGTVNFTALAPTTELLHHYPMSGTLVDAAGGENGTLVGGASLVDGLLQLDGSTGYGEFGTWLVPGSGSYSVSLFVRDAGPTNRYATYLSQGQSNGPGFYIGYADDGQLRGPDGFGAVGIPALAGDGLFHHYVLVADAVANQTRFYVDGTLRRTAGGALTTTPNGTTTRLGRQFEPWAEFLDGDIDEVRIYRGALDAAQVAALHTSGATTPGRLVYGTQPVNVAAGALMAPAVVVRAEDALGRLKTDFNGPVSIALFGSPAGVTLGGTRTVNAVAGIATFATLTVDAVGTGYQLTATASGAASVTSTPFNVTAGAATALAFVQQPTTVPAGAPITPPVTVEVRDALGNRVTAYNGNVTIAMGTNPGGATLGGTVTGIVVSGVATFSTLSVSAAGAGYTLVASAPGLTDATSAAFTVGASLAVNAWTNIAGGNWSDGSNWSLGRAPLPADSVVIALDGTYTVTLDAAATVGVMTVGGGTGTKTFNVANQTLTVNTSLRTVVGGALVTGNGIITGAGAVENGGQFTSNGGTVQTSLTNAGLLLVRGGLNVTGALTTVPGSTIRVQANGTFGPVGMNVSAGFTNHGLIDLTSETANDAALAVQSGVFVNAADGMLAGGAAAGGNRYFNGALDNQGTITIGTFFPMTLTGTGNTNTGTINVGGTLNLGFSGGVGTLTNSGSVVIGAGQTLALTSGTWVQNASGSTTGGLFPVTPGATLRLLGGTIASNVANSGLVEATDASNITGTFSMNTGSQLRIAPLGASGVAAVLTIANGFTNSGTIELTNLLDTPRAEAARLALTAGTLTNAAGGVIRTLPGNGGGDRGITGNVANAGLLDVAPGSAGRLEIAGNLATTGTVVVDLGGATPGALYDQVTVTGTATLGGTLNAGLFGGFVPPMGSSFVPLTAGTVTGTFATVNAASPLLPTPTYSATAVTLNGPVALLANSWTNVSGGNWTVGTNWSLGRAPIASDTVLIVLPGDYTVSMDVNDTVAVMILGGGTGTQTLAVGARTLRVDSLLAIAPSGAVTITGAAGNLTGPGVISNQGTLSTINGVISASQLVNQGALTLRGTTTLSSALTNAAGATMTALASSVAGSAALTVTNGFVNDGLIQLTTADASYSNGMFVTNGTLVNTVNGIIRATAGFGGKSLNAQLENQGLIELQEGLTLSRASSAHINSGTINVAIGNFTVTQTGTTPSFTNTGAITLAAGRAMAVTGGTLNLIGGTIDGPTGRLTTNATAVALDVASARTQLTLTNTTVGGTVTIAAGDSLRLVAGSPTMTIVNNGRLVLQDVMTFNGTVTTGDTTSVIEVRSAAAFGQGNVTFANGFTNTGRIELRTLDAAYGNRFAVTTGSLVNAPTGIIRAIPGNGSKDLAAQLENQGLLDVREALTLTRASSAHINSGTIELATANLTVTQTGTTPSFTNSGTINAPAGRTLTVSGGTLNLTGGTFNGPAATLATSATTVNMDIASARTRLTLANSTVPGTFTIPAGDSLRLVGGSPNMTITNSGRLVLQDVLTFPGTVATGDTTSVIEIRSAAAYGQGNVTFTNGFTNTGLIELRTLDAAYGNRLAVTNGTLVNAPTGIIRTVTGFGSKELAAQLDNQGLLDVREALVLNRASSAHLNSGLVDLATANLSVTQTGTTPSFTNTGTINAPAGRTLSVSGGTLNLTGGTFNGPAATLSTNASTLNMDITSARTRFNLINTTVPGTFTIPAGDSLRLVAGSPNMTITNNGRLVLQDVLTFPGTVSTGDLTSVIEVRSSAAYGQGNVTFTNGFTNTGLIELRTLDAAYGNRFAVTNGTLVNAPGAIIRAVPGFGSKELAAQLDNQGTLEVDEVLILNRASSAHLNSGLVDLTTANLTVTQTGTTPSFTNTGTITAPAGRTLSVSGGTLNLTGGTFIAPTATLSTNATTVNTDIASARTRFNLVNSTVPGTFTIPAGDSLRLVAGSPNMTIANSGRLVLQDVLTFPGTVTTGDTTSVIEIRSSAVYGQGNVTFTNGFTNTGLIELRTLDAAYGLRLAVTNGTLVNAPTGIIRAVTGFGSKELAAQLDNQGLLDVREALTLNRASSAHLNSGLIDLATANLTLTQTGTTPSFTNTGTITAPTGRTFSVSGGTLSLTGGTFNGPAATLSTNGTTVNMDIASARTRFNLVNTTVPGTFTIPANDSLRLVAGSPNMTIANNGRLVLQDVMTFPGTVTTGDINSVIEIRSSSVYGQGNVTFTNGFTNTGLIELRTLDAAYGLRLAVTNGTLVNAPTGVIRAVPGFGSKELAAQLDNQGLLDVDEVLTLNRASSAHLNTGVIDMTTANLTVSQTGTTPSFASTGTITAGTGRTFTVTGGTLSLTGGTFDGPAATLSTSATTVNFDLPSVNSRLRLTNSTVPGTLTIPAGDTLRLTGGSPTMTLVNDGTLLLQDILTVNGTLTSSPGSVVEALSSAEFGQAQVTFANAFTNNGTFRLRTADASYGQAFTFSSGTLVNGASGTISFEGIGGRTLTAPAFTNGGTWNVASTTTVNGPIAQNASLTVQTGSVLTLSSLLTLNALSSTTVNGTLVKNGGCSLNGGTISGGGTGASCP